MAKDTILSLTPNKDALVVRETAVQSAGFKVTSVMTPSDVGASVTKNDAPTTAVPSEQPSHFVCIGFRETVTDQQRRTYPSQFQILPLSEGVPVDADITVPESNGAELIVQALRENHGQKAPLKI